MAPVKLSGMISAGKYRDGSPTASSDQCRGCRVRREVNLRLGPGAVCEDHKTLFRSVMASARILRLDIDLTEPIDINELNARLSKSSDYAQRMALKRNLSLMGCL
jgi:hypothetical protein